MTKIAFTLAAFPLHYSKDFFHLFVQEHQRQSQEIYRISMVFLFM